MKTSLPFWQPSLGFILVILLLLPGAINAQTPTPTPVPTPEAHITPLRDNLVGQEISFDASSSILPQSETPPELLWDFGDFIRTTGQSVTHTYKRAGDYTVTLKISSDQEPPVIDTAHIKIYDRSMILVSDGSASADQLQLAVQQAAQNGVLLIPITANDSPEVLTEEDLTQRLLDARSAVDQSRLLVVWTSGGVGPNVLSKFAQHLRQSTSDTLTSSGMSEKGVVLLSQTPFGVISRTAQSAFDQLRPSYILLTRPDALPLLFKATNAEEARAIVFSSPIEHRLLGTFSQRAVSDLNPLNLMSFGLNYLVNHGVPINNLVLILMLPVIATILAFARQVIGIKAFGLITPTMTTLAFLVMGLKYGLIVFLVVVLSGTVTRILLRQLRLLYLPRMALVLTSASLAILVLLGFSAAAERTAALSFSIFPILILIILAEEYISVQFKQGERVAITTTVWTLILAVGCYYIVSWELFRTLLLSYPEIILLTIPLNIILGRWTGLRIVEYVRFRELLRYGRNL